MPCLYRSVSASIPAYAGTELRSVYQNNSLTEGSIAVVVNSVFISVNLRKNSPQIHADSVTWIYADRTKKASKRKEKSRMARID